LVFLPQHHFAKQAKPVGEDFDTAMESKDEWSAEGSKLEAEFDGIETGRISSALLDPAIFPPFSPQQWR
jgi:hypothetical protein